MSAARTDPRIDTYIAKSAPFARPILERLRTTVHAACPKVEETIKWGVPHFDYHGGMMAAMAAFKAHAVFGFWHGSVLLGASSKNAEAMGDFGRITDVKDLPSKAATIALIKQAMKLNETGYKRVPRKPVKRTPLRVPKDLAAALASNKKAAATFEGFSPSNKREYLEWITEAKTDATRERRLEQAIVWMAEGKSRNWKYQK